MKKFTRLLRSILLFPMMLAFGAVTHNTNTIDGNLSAENKTFYDRTLLKRLKPRLVFWQYGQKRPIPKKEGDTINFRRYAALPADTTVLTEGVTPPGSELSETVITAKAKQYGKFVTLSDKLDMVGIDNNATEAAEILGDWGGLTVDTVVRDIVANGSNVLYATGTGTEEVGAANVITSDLIKKAVRALRRQNANPVEGKYFIGFIHPDTAYDIQNDPLWQDVSKYNGGESIIDGEVGKIHGVRFIETTNAPIFAGAGSGGADVYGTIIIGADAYGCIEIEGEGAPRVLLKDTKSGGTEDPLEQRSTVGCKFMMTAARLDELSMIRIEHGTTA